MTDTQDLNSLIQAFQSLSSEEVTSVLQSLSRLETSHVKIILNLLEPRQRVEIAKHLIFSTKSEYIEDLKYAITTEYELRKSRGELFKAPAPRIGKTKLEIKRIPYHHKGVSKRYTYVYVMRYRDNAFRCLGRLFQTEDSHEYRYTLLENGGLAFSEREVFKLTSLRHPEQSKLIRLLRLEAPPLEYEFQDKSALGLQVPLVYEILHPETYQPQRQQRVDFPHCVNSGSFKKQLWQVETVDLLAITDAMWSAAETRSPLLQLEIPMQAAQKTIAALTHWQRLSEVAFSAPWYLSLTPAAYRLVHGQGQMLLEFQIREQRLWSHQLPKQLAYYFESLGLALVEKSQSASDGQVLYQEGTKLVTQMQSFQTRKGRSGANVLQWLLDVASV